MHAGNDSGEVDPSVIRWILDHTNSDDIARAIRLDVGRRQSSANDFTDESFWQFAADAAIEAILFPLLRSIDPQ